MRALSYARWGIVIALAAALVIPALVVSLGGRTIVEVTGSSMSPTLKVGDVAIIRPMDPAQLRPGDVVTVRDADVGYVTHRVLEVGADGRIQLKGDANTFADPTTHGASDVLGVLDTVLTPPTGLVLIELQRWPFRISVLVTLLGLAFLPLHANRAKRANRATRTSRSSRSSRGRRAHTASPIVSTPTLPLGETYVVDTGTYSLEGIR